MKTDINSKGILTITPNSELEKYALRKWWENFENGDYSSSLKLDFEGNEKCPPK